MMHQGDNVEEHLVEHARSLHNQKGGRSSVHLHLSKLNPKNRQPYHLRIATHMLADNVKKFEGDVYLMDNSDLIFLCKGATRAQLDETILKVRYFFSGDPLFSDSEDEEPPEDDPFFSWYDLSIDWREFLADTEEMLSDKLQRQSQTWDADDELPDNVSPLDPARLNRLQKGLSHTDVSSFLRRQPICRIKGDEVPEPIFYELYVRVIELQRATLPDVDLLANRWLFMHLTQTLDDRVLTLLTKYSDEHVNGPISINFNIDTIFLPKFLAWTNRLDRSTRRRIGLEFQLVDVIANIDCFHFARTFLKESEFIVTLDGVSYHCLPDLQRAELDVDLIKVNWDANGFAGSPQDQKDSILAAVKDLGVERMIFTRCGNQSMIEAGQSMGVQLFQGRYIDRVVNPNSRRIN